jgi:8-oxo-dGTP diphosphatase
MLRIASIILVDYHGMALLQQRTLDAPTFPGVWSFFGGTIANDETPQQAACRELFEELEIAISPAQLSFFGAFVETNKKRYVYVLPITGSERLQLKEGRGLGFFSRDEIIHLQIQEAARLILQQYFDRKMNGEPAPARVA